MKVHGITYQVDENFKGGNYELIISDVTQGIAPEKRMLEQKIELVVIDPEELAAQQAAAAAAAGAKGGAKKK